MRGDKIEVVIEIGDGKTRTWVMEATKNGRTLEVETVRSDTNLIEKTHTGKAIRTWTFKSARVVALVEIPSSESDGQPDPDDEATEPLPFA